MGSDEYCIHPSLHWVPHGTVDSAVRMSWQYITLSDHESTTEKDGGSGDADDGDNGSRRRKKKCQKTKQKGVPA